MLLWEAIIINYYDPISFSSDSFSSFLLTLSEVCSFWVKYIDSFKTFVFTAAEYCWAWVSLNAVLGVRGKCFDQLKFDVSRIGQCVKQSLPSGEKQVWSPLSTPLNRRAHGSQHSIGDCGVCKLAWFPFGQKLPQKSLSRHFFGLGNWITVNPTLSAL